LGFAQAGQANNEDAKRIIAMKRIARRVLEG
jgi:hypothetical protein